MYRFRIGLPLLAGVISSVSMAVAEPIKYPEARRENRVEVQHGTEVPDPYRWLETDVRESAEVKAWVEAQNKITSAYLAAIPEREPIKKRITDLWNYERYSAPSGHGGKYFFSKNDGLQNQAVLYVQDRLDGEARVLIDPNAWTKDGTIALGAIEPSPDAKYMAYSTSEAGSDWQTWRVLDVATGKPLADELKWVKFSGAAWTSDGKGFFYSRFDEPKPGEKFQSLNLNQKLMFHKIGTPQSEDELVYKRPDHPEWGFAAETTEDGKFVVIATWKGTDSRNRVTYRDLSKADAKPVDLIDTFDNDYTFLGGEGTVFYFRTDLDAPNNRVIAIDITKPEKANWKEIIPEAKEKLQGVSIVGNRFVAQYLKDARSQVKIFALDGKFEKELELPGIGTAGGFGGKQKDMETFFSYSSYNAPPSTYRYDFTTGKATQLRAAKVKFNPDDYIVEQKFFESSGGARVPMFITRRRDTKLDGTNPTLLYGYGGFNISLTPGFSVSIASWLDMGGIYVVANLRGGGEYGKSWHKAGTKLTKQNVFDDFIKSAEYLIKEKYTSPSKLAVKGGSNGGLLVGAVMTQRPDLFGACLPHVGVMDMLRFHKFTAGRFWVDDYGSPDNADEFKALFAYSPYHNLKPGTKYPPTMVITADTDDRVVPGHSFKFSANLQYCQSGDSPVLARIETRAGHGAGKPTAKAIEELADEYAFLVKNLKMNVRR